MVDVVVDTREKSAIYISSFIEAGIVPKLQKLDTGDFLFYGKTEKDATLIEAKTASDFLSSIEGKRNPDGSWVQGRIWDQLKRMKETGIKDRCVLIEGNPMSSRLTAYRKKGFNKYRIWGAYEGIAKWGVRIIHVKNKKETIDYLLHVAKKKKRPKKEFTLRTSPPKSMTLREKRLYLLQGLPGVGPKTSKRILKNNKSLLYFFQHISKSKAIGEKIKKEIKKIVL